MACTVQSACPDTILTARRYKVAAGPDEQVEVRPARNAAFGFERLIKGRPGDAVRLHYILATFPVWERRGLEVSEGGGVGVSLSMQINPGAGPYGSSL